MTSGPAAHGDREMERLRDVFHRLASALTASPDYAGLDHEDPEVFIRRFEGLLRRHEVEDEQRVRVAEKA